jgi:hypothetical protein
MNARNALRAAVTGLALLLSLPAVAAAGATKPAMPPAMRADAWPREIRLASAMLRVYPPQVSRWADSELDFRSALAIKPDGGGADTFGVVFATARTHVDKVTRTVMLDGFKVTRVEFPALPDKGAAYAAEIGAKLAGVARTVSLDRLQLSLAVAGASATAVAVRNDPPRVIVSESPALLVPIDGAPVMQPVAGSPGFSRVVNTRALILKSAAAPQYFLRVYDGWLMAGSLDGTWSQPFLPPDGMDAVAKKIAATGVVDMLDGGPRANPRPSLANGIPAIFVSTVPAELIVFGGKPDFVPIVGTTLTWAANTTSDVLRDTASNDYYALLAGRWFRAAALSGPWSYVANNALPQDFAKIPATSRAGAVLPAVAGTVAAREAVIENMIPQTATVPLVNGPTFTARFDGAPQFAPIAGTTLSYAVNAAVPVIQTAPDAYYAVKAGIWFTAKAPAGPWAIATSVPAAIYTIPPSSPLFFATFVRIYNATADAVFTGYTPGYLGAMVGSAGTVVYGTGYAYTPYLGNVWLPGPATYGIAAAPIYNRYVGYTYGFAMGLATVDFAQSAGGAHFHPGYWGGYPCCGSASANVYKYWGRSTYAKSRVQSGAGRKQGGAAKSATAAAAPVARGPAPQPNAPATVTTNGLPPPPIVAANAPYSVATQQALTMANRGYDMTMVTNADASSAPTAPSVAKAINAAKPPQYISAVEYYKSIGQQPPTAAASPAPSNVYADAQGNVYRNDGAAWQQAAPAGWTSAPSAPPGMDDEASGRTRAEQAGMQAGSYSMSNTTRFTGAQNDGWTARDSGDGGYSRTLGGDGGISAEAWQYNNDVLNNEFDIAMNGGWWGEGVYIGGIGWGGRYGD